MNLNQSSLFFKKKVAWRIYLSRKVLSMLLSFLAEAGDSSIIAVDMSSDNSDVLDCDDNISLIHLFERFRI
jgi:hypothetical protein